MATPAPILITGAGGFLGTRLVERLVAGGQPVVAACRALNARLLALQEKMPGQLRHLAADFRHDLPRGTLSGRYQAVVHLASYVPSPHNPQPATDIHAVSSGIIGTTVRVLEELRGCTDTLVLGSSVSVYGSQHAGIVDETACCRPTDLYGVCKLASEGICRSFGETERWTVTILRLTQLYGEHEPHGRFMHRVFLPQARSGGRIMLTAGGREQKDLLWVDDAADGIARALARPSSGTYNLSSGAGVTIREVAEILKELAGGRVSLDVRDEGGAVPDQVFDRRRATERFGFQPVVGIREGLERIWRE